MNRSIAARLIAKDLYLYRWLMVLAVVAGFLSFVVSRFSSGDHVTTGMNAGILLFITTVIAFGISIPMLVLKERQDKSQLFVLSLPVSPAQYSIAKVGAAVVAFLLPWLTLTGAVVLITVLSDRPDGGLPFFVLMMTFFFTNFCLLMALTVITMSEMWVVAGILVTNISVPLFLSKVAGHPGIAGRSRDAVAVWSPAFFTILAIELALILASLALAFYIPARNRDFI